MINKNFWNITSIYGIGFVFLRGISFLLLPLYTNLLSTKEAGQTFVFLAFLAFMNAFFAMGMDSSLLKYYNNKNSISTSFIGLFVIVLPLIVFLLLFSNVLSTALFNNQPIWIFASIIVLSLDVFSSRIITIIRILQLPFYYLTVCLANVITSLILNVFFLQALELSVLGVLLAMIGTSFIQLVFSVPVLFKFSFNLTFDYKLFKKMFVFAWPFFPAAVFLIIIELSDRFMIQYFLGLESVGLYGAGYKVAALILIIIKAFNLNWQPHYLKQEKNNVQLAQKEFEQIGNLAIVGLIFLGTILCMFYPFFFTLSWNGFSIIGAEFLAGRSVVPWVVCGYILYGVFILQMPSIYLKNKQLWAPVFWGCGALINILCNLILIPKLGFVGAGISTLIAYTAMAMFLYYKNRAWLPIKYNIKLIFIVALVSLFFLSTTTIYKNLFIFLISAAIYSLLIGRLLVFYKKTTIQEK